MQEGLAQICLITASMTLVRAKIDQNIPRKRKGNVKQHEKVSHILCDSKNVLIWIQ
jgi:protein pelota